jgi:NADH-quinone oxidoreductase subunit D
MQVVIRSSSVFEPCSHPELVKGLKIADLFCVLGSFDILMGEIDR